MKQIKIGLIFFALIGVVFSCKKQLDIKNPNQPTPETATTESGIIAFAQGGVYVNGFSSLKYGGFFGTFWNDVIGYHELMGDIFGVEAANQHINQFSCPNWVILDDGTKVLNPNSPKKQIDGLRQFNTNANASDNPFYYEWAYMYSMNKGCNRVLSLVDNVEFSGDAATKAAVLKAWAYFWKGYAYSRIGSFYYAGIINDDVENGTNNTYVTKEAMIAEANANFDKAATALGGLTNNADYSDVLGKLIPQYFQVGKGGVIPPDMWKRNINTMKARNLLVNTTTASMSSAQWGEILSLVNDGIKEDDLVFTGRSNDNGDFFSPTGGTVSALSVGAEPGYRMSERLIQDFRTGDKRLENNYEMRSAPWIGNADRGNVFNTRWDLLDGGKGLSGVVVLGTQTAGDYELYIAGTYEENELMKAEALINTNDIAGGLTVLDNIRDYQGAGLAPVSGVITALLDAKEELRSERRVALVYRGLSFYDARRWGVIDDVDGGGTGRTKCIVVDAGGNLNTNATINYGFLDYWDVPDNELAYNPPGDGSAPVKNPK